MNSFAKKLIKLADDLDARGLSMDADELIKIAVEEKKDKDNKDLNDFDIKLDMQREDGEVVGGTVTIKAKNGISPYGSRIQDFMRIHLPAVKVIREVSSHISSAEEFPNVYKFEVMEWNNVGTIGENAKTLPFKDSGLGEASEGESLPLAASLVNNLLKFADKLDIEGHPEFADRVTDLIKEAEDFGGGMPNAPSTDSGEDIEEMGRLNDPAFKDMTVNDLPADIREEVLRKIYQGKLSIDDLENIRKELSRIIEERKRQK